MATICKFCECNIEHKDWEKHVHKTFEQLVTESSSKMRAHVSNERLGRLGVIRWLLQHASKFTIEASKIESIVDQCAYSCENEIAGILKTNGVEIKVNSEELHRTSSNWRNSAMYFAVTLGTPEIVSWVLENSINSHVTLKDLQAMVTEATWSNNLDNLVHFVSLGAEIDSHEKLDKRECLTVAAQKGHLHIVQLIFENKLVHKDSDTWAYALHDAMRCRQYHVVQYLVETCGVDVNKKTSHAEPLMHQAAYANNVNLMKWLVKNGANLFQRCVLNQTPLHIAARQYSFELFRWLVEVASKTNEVHTNPSVLISTQHLCIEYLVHRNYDVNADRGDGFTPLHFAASNNNVGVFKFLVQHGADINVIYYDELNTRERGLGLSLLHSACNSLEIIKELVDLGLDINARTFMHQSVLNLAAERADNVDTVQWLLEKGLPLDDVLVEAWSWLLEMDYDEEDAMLMLVLKQMSDTGKDINMLIKGETLLHTAVICLQAVKVLLAHKADINARRTKDCSTPLICSLKKEDDDSFSDFSDQSSNAEPRVPVSELLVAQYLLSRGADVNLKTNAGETALYRAMVHRNVDVIRQLVELGADVNAVTQEGVSVLIQGISETSDLEIIKLIVKAGADVNHLDSQDKSAVNIAGTEKHWDIVRYLVENGADAGHKPRHGNPVICDALKTGNLELVTWLINHDALVNVLENFEMPLLHGCKWFKNECDKYELIKLLVSCGVTLDELNDNGESILHTCINNIKIVDFLLENCNNVRFIATYDEDNDVIYEVEVHFVNYENGSSRTALHILCADSHDSDSQNKIQIVRKLIKHGANVNTSDYSGVTPLHMAVGDPIHTDVARFLVSKGANINAKDKDCNSVLHCTVNGELAMWLCEQGADINTKTKKDVSVLQAMIQTLPKQTSNANIVNVLRSQMTCEDTRASLDSVQSVLYARKICFIQYLIDNVTDVNEQDNSGISAIHYAAVKDNVTVMQMLVQRGADLLSKTKNGNTVLQYAVAMDSMAAISYILCNMEQDLVMVENNINNTPLHTAVHLNNVDIVRMFLKHDVDLNYDLTAFIQLAYDMKSVYIAKIFMDHANRMV
jgi:ankyrin repeat protein